MNNGSVHGMRAAVAVTLAAVVVGCSSATGYSLAPGGQRPADGCAMLTSDQVSEIVGTPGPFTGAHWDRRENGTQDWGCIWGTHLSSAYVREIAAGTYQRISAPAAESTVTPLQGIGDRALLRRDRDDGGNADVYFAINGRYYNVEISVDRSGGDDRPNYDHEADAEQDMSKILTEPAD